MYIKQIIIQGFKSYRDQTVIEPFDHRHNVVVGRNGSGKSNFFYAIQFVLSDEFSHLRPDQRQALLHEGTGPRVISAYVEIIFDNSDGRLPIDKEEVYLRRVIGSKKDQYFLNKKVVPKTDVMNLLESAGFSRSNPYYIVKQGKINQMATAPDSQRLKLLREVAGTRVYDERREESKVLLKECESKREKIEEFLRTIEDRLSALEEEKEELKEYQKWDKMRRSLEYTIHDRELKDNRKKLDDMENQRNNSGKEQEKLKNQLQNAQEKAKTAAKELKDVKSKVGAAKEERDAYNAENQQLLKDRTRLELTIRDLSDEVMGDNKSKERAEQELEKLRQTISQKEGELEKNRPQYEEMKRKEEECTRELSLKEQKRKELYAKQGRGSQFTSKDQRDQWIQKELRSLNKQIKDKKEQIDRLSEDLTKDAEKKVQLERRIEEMTGEMDRYRLSIDDHNKGFYDMKKRKDQLQSERNELWRKENNLQQTLASLKEELSRADQSLRSMAGKPILNGRDSVRKVLDTFRERGGQWAEYATMYYGPVIELFDCEKTIYTAVEVTAGNRLFHHVVDSDKVGTQILKEMNKQKLPGEVTFMPLNRLAVRDIEYPQTNDAIPMVSKMNYDDRYDKALKYIFGRTLICRNLEVATQLAKTNRLDCVTMDGDQVMSKGSLTGGYFNTSRSRLEIQKTRSEFMQQIAESEDEFSTLKDQLRSTEAEINKIVSEMQRTETKNSKAKDVFDKVKADIRLMKEELNGIERSRQPKERSLNTLRANLEAMMNTKDGLESELHQDLMTTLSVEDQHEVDKLNDDIRRLTRENKEAFSMRMKLEAEKNKLENLLTNNLNRRKDELMQALQEISVEDRKRQLEHSKAELARSEEKIADVSKNLKDFEKKVSALQKKQKEAQKEVETWKTKEKEVQERIDEDAKDLEKMASRQNVLQNKIAECTKKIRELGSLPSDAFDKYQALSTKQLFKKLEQSNGELKKYSHVNKKALDQFVHFSEHKEKLMQRKDQQNRGYEKIMELMSVLEQRKFEAIQFTFKQVSKNFTEVFGKLVPQGHAQLIMKTDQDDDDDDEPARPTTVDSFTGVGIRVSFSGKRAEMREMNQLSGGQKSLVALALIFAIQKCDTILSSGGTSVADSITRMFRSTLVLLAVMACVQSRPQLLNQGVPVSPSSSGTANSGITKGETVLPTGGVSTLVQQQAATGGQAASGGFNVGSASGNTQSQTGLLGTSSSSNTDAQSQQGSVPGFGSLGGGFVMPSIPVIPGFGTGSAQGQAGSNIVKGETIGPHGGSTNIVQQQSGTGGQASNGGFNVGSASGNTQSQTGLLGTSSSSNTNAQSQQGSLPGFGTFGGAFPAVPAFPGFVQGSAQGQAGSSVIKGETINPFGGSSTVVQQQASTGGQAANGGVNVGSASSNNQNLNTPLGSSSSSNTNSQSSQFTNPGFGGVPGLPGLPVIPGFGSATGNAGSQLTQGKTTGPDGSQTTITQLGSSAGGSASNGGSSVNQASGSTSSIDGVSGSQTQSNLNSQSVQTGR